MSLAFGSSFLFIRHSNQNIHGETARATTSSKFHHEGNTFVRRILYGNKAREQSSAMPQDRYHRPSTFRGTWEGHLNNRLLMYKRPNPPPPHPREKQNTTSPPGTLGIHNTLPIVHYSWGTRTASACRTNTGPPPLWGLSTPKTSNRIARQQDNQKGTKRMNPAGGAKRTVSSYVLLGYYYCVLYYYCPFSTQKRKRREKRVMHTLMHVYADAWPSRFSTRFRPVPSRPVPGWKHSSGRPVEAGTLASLHPRRVHINIHTRLPSADPPPPASTFHQAT